MKPSQQKNETRSVFDVQASSEKKYPGTSFIKKFFYDKNVLNLRPNLRLRNRRAWVLGILVLAAVIFFGASRLFIRGEVNDFYPTTCLGTWQNTANAEGPPETLTSAGASFTANNSAMYASGTQIFCGGFVPPSFATSGAITNVGLTLVWQVGDETTSSQTVTLQPVTVTPAATTTATTTVVETSTASSTDSSGDSAATSSNNTPDNSPAPAPVPTPETTPVSPAPAPDDSATTSAPTSFLRNLIPFAFADDLSSTASSVATSVVLGPPLVASLAPATTTTTTATTTPTAPSSTTTISAPIPPSPPDENFLDVSYTTDGQTWVSLGKVSIENWQKMTVTLPISDWQDLQNLQVRIEGIPTTQDPLPPVYLDGMFMEVHYEASTDVNPDDVTSTSTPVAASTSTSPARMTLLDPGAHQTCDIKPFSQVLPRGGSVDYVVNLHPSIDGVSYELTTGHLPAGISLSIGEPIAQIAATSSLGLQATTAAEVGSMNIQVIYHEHEADGTVVANYCQLNIIVQ